MSELPPNDEIPNGLPAEPNPVDPETPLPPGTDEGELAKEALMRQFENHPNRKEALSAKDKEGGSVYATRGISKKLYRCPCCHDAIDIGAEHVIMSKVQVSKRYTHHHLHNNCFQEEILPTFREVKAIKPEAASATKMNKRRRQKRYRQG